MRAVALELTRTGLTLGVLDEDAALGTFHQTDEANGQQRDDRYHQHGHRRERAGAALFEQLADGAGKIGDNAGHDNQRNAVANPAAGNLFTEPHQEHGATDQRDDRGDAEEHARVDNSGHTLTGTPAFQADGDAIALHGRQENGAVAGVLIERLAARIAFFL